MQAYTSRLLRGPALTTLPIPTVGEGQVLVKVRAMALNPTDWKHAKITWGGLILGCDFAGEVHTLGEGVKGFQLGDRVGGLVHGCHSATSGAAAEYALTASSLLWKIPKVISFEQASTLGVGMCSAAYALDQMGWEVPGGGEKTSNCASEPLLVWSAGTSTGLHLVMLSHRLRPSDNKAPTITTSSPTHFPLLTSCGATHTLSYRSDPISDLVTSIKKIAEPYIGGIKQAMDCFSEGDTTKHCIDCLGDDGGIVVRTLPPRGGATDKIKLDWVVTYHATGEDFVFLLKSYKGSPRLHNIAHETLKSLEEWTADGSITPVPIKVIPGGLTGLDEGYGMLRRGEVKGQKVVVSL